MRRTPYYSLHGAVDLRFEPRDGSHGNGLYRAQRRRRLHDVKTSPLPFGGSHIIVFRILRRAKGEC